MYGNGEWISIVEACQRANVENNKWRRSAPKKNVCIVSEQQQLRNNSNNLTEKNKGRKYIFWPTHKYIDLFLPSLTSESIQAHRCCVHKR